MKEVKFALGPRATFRHYQRGHTQIDMGRLKARQFPIQVKRVSAEHTAKVTDAVADGMVARSDRWKQLNQRHEAGGEYSHRFEVLQIKGAGPDTVDPTPVGNQIQLAAAVTKLTELLEGLLAKK